MTNFPMNTAARLTGFLTLLGFPETAVKAAVRRNFPEADADAEYAAAMKQKAESDQQLEQALDREAVEQEMKES